MSEDDIRQLVVEVGDKLYSGKDSPIYKLTSVLLAEIMNNFEVLLVEVLSDMEKVRKTENETSK